MSVGFSSTNILLQAEMSPVINKVWGYFMTLLLAGVQSTVMRVSICMSACITQQEGQHPLTGQRAANFRLLANQ